MDLFFECVLFTIDFHLAPVQMEVFFILAIIAHIAIHRRANR